MTILSKAPPLPGTLYPAFVSLGSLFNLHNTESDLLSQLSQLVPFWMHRSMVNSLHAGDAQGSAV